MKEFEIKSLIEFGLTSLAFIAIVYSIALLQ